MKHLLRLSVLVVGACLTGCFSLDSATSPASGNEHILVTNYGWQLFNCIPLVCGNAKDPTDPSYGGPVAFFRDDVTMDKIQDRLMSHAARHGKTPTDLSYHNYDTIFISIPTINVSIPIPYIICYREIQLSGVLK